MSIPIVDGDTAIDIKSYITDPKWVGYQVLTNYESTYWAPLVGNDAWRLYEVLRSFCHNGKSHCFPSINLLLAILSIKDRSVLIGRGKLKVTKIKREDGTIEERVYAYPGLIQALQEHNLVIAEVTGEGPKLQYTFHVNLSPGLLMESQLSRLPLLLQTRHAQLLEKCDEEWKALEAKKRPSKLPKPVQHSEQAPDEKQGIGNSNTPLTTAGNSNTPSWNFQYKQQPINTTQLKTTRAREDHNNNTDDAHPQPNVVVALLAQGIAKSVAQRLASRYNYERVAEKIEFLAYLKDTDPKKVKNPQGWLRRAIEEDYAAPDGYIPTAEREAKAIEEQRRQEERQQALAQQAQRQREEQIDRQREAAERLAALQKTYGTTQKEIDLWQQILAEFQAQQSIGTFQTYLANTVLLSIRDGEALIGLPHGWARDWIENRLTKKIQQTLAAYLGGQIVTPKFIVLQQDAE